MSEKKISSYGKIWAVGSSPVRELFMEGVTIQEKIDGSQISFGLIAGELVVRSKNVELHLDDAGMFQLGVNALRERTSGMVPGWVYRGEYLAKPKHNHLEYARTPLGHIVVWDVQPEPGKDSFLSSTEALDATLELDLEYVKPYYVGQSSFIHAEKFMGQPSMLGGKAPAEGIVIKNYERIDPKLGNPLFAKLVREEFKEDQKREWKTENQTSTDIRRTLGESLRSPARWRKGVQRLQEAGVHTGTPKDIGPLIQSVKADLRDEMRGVVAEQLLKWAWTEVERLALHGIPEWYKEELTATPLATDTQPSETPDV